MALTNKQKTALNFKAFYEGILPYLNGEVPTFANAFNKSDLYSTDEKIIGSWIDGRPIYQKTIVIGDHVLTSNDNLINHNISNLDRIISANGYFERANEDRGFLWNIPLGSTTYQFCLREYTDTQLHIEMGNAYVTSDDGRIAKVVITVRYTKTGDSAIKVGDGNDYSTDEQIVGTWIDGSVLYQKTVVTGGSVPSGATLIERIVQTGYDTLRYTKSS